MALALRAILPRRSVVPAQAAARAGVSRFLRDFAFEAARQMAEYPPARPWRSRPPRRGPRAGGRRTGFYGRGWGVGIRLTPTSAEVSNSASYAVYVGGPNPGQGKGRRQARALRARGWKSVSDVAPVLRRRYNAQLLLRYVMSRR
jgi:hypothetical protein